MEIRRSKGVFPSEKGSTEEQKPRNLSGEELTKKERVDSEGKGRPVEGVLRGGKGKSEH